MPDSAREDELRWEFNRWAEAGKGEAMEQDHWPITQPVLARMGMAADDNILDLGCGAGWLSRMLAKSAPQGCVVGMDISDEMVRRARQKSMECENLVFIVGAAEEIPWESDFFSKMISVESSYYWPDPAKSLREVFRVLREGGSAWILINYYRDNPHCHQWVEILEIPAKLLSAAEWSGLFREAGFRNVAHRLIPDPTPNPETYSGRWFRDAKHLAEFRVIGALLVHGEK